MGTDKETKTDFIERQYYATIVYEKQLFNFPKILDLCVLYGRSNRSLVQQIVNHLFQVQPRYLVDGTSSIELLLRVLETTASQLLVIVRKNPSVSTSSLAQFDLAEQGKQLGDIKSYIVDIFVSLDSFLEIYPPGSSCFCSSPLAFFSAATVWYEVHLELLLQAYQSTLSTTAKGSKPTVTSKRITEVINVVRAHILNTVNILLSAHFLEFCLNQHNPVTERGKRGSELLDCLQLLFDESSRFRESHQIPGNKSEAAAPQLLRDLLTSSSSTLMSSLEKLVKAPYCEMEPKRLTLVLSALSNFADTTTLLRICGTPSSTPSSAPSVDKSLIKVISHFTFCFVCSDQQSFLCRLSKMYSQTTEMAISWLAYNSTTTTPSK